MFYQKLLHELAPDLNPAGVEASMRLQYGTLNHLPREVFAEEAKLAADCERTIQLVDGRIVSDAANPLAS